MNAPALVRRAAVLLGLLLALAGSAGAGPAPEPARPAPASPAAPADTLHPLPRPERQVVVTYFHTTQRCATCRRLETLSREAIETGFPAELKSGAIVFRMVNYEEKGNEHFVKDYDLYTKSLIVTDEFRGKPGRWANLEKIWQLVQDREKFLRYVQQETRAFMTPKS